MKKYATILFSTALLFSLAACSGENAGNEVQDSDLTSLTTVVAETAAPTEEKAQASFEETILVDNDICTFKITAIQEDSIWAPFFSARFTAAPISLYNLLSIN